MKDILNFATNNSGLLAALFIALIGLFSAIISKNKQQVYTRLYALVAQAQLFENATGSEKFTYVFDKAYNSLPLWLKLFVSEDNIKRGIEYSLNKLKAFAKSKIEALNVIPLNSNIPINNTVQEVKSVVLEKIIPAEQTIAQ